MSDKRKRTVEETQESAKASKIHELSSPSAAIARNSSDMPEPSLYFRTIKLGSTTLSAIVNTSFPDSSTAYSQVLGTVMAIFGSDPSRQNLRAEIEQAIAALAECRPREVVDLAGILVYYINLLEPSNGVEKAYRRLAAPTYTDDQAAGVHKETMRYFLRTHAEHCKPAGFQLEHLAQQQRSGPIVAHHDGPRPSLQSSVRPMAFNAGSMPQAGTIQPPIPTGNTTPSSGAVFNVSAEASAKLHQTQKRLLVCTHVEFSLDSIGADAHAAGVETEESFGAWQAFSQRTLLPDRQNFQRFRNTVWKAVIKWLKSCPHPTQTMLQAVQEALEPTQVNVNSGSQAILQGSNVTANQDSTIGSNSVNPDRLTTGAGVQIQVSAVFPPVAREARHVPEGVILLLEEFHTQLINSSEGQLHLEEITVAADKSGLETEESMAAWNDFRRSNNDMSDYVVLSIRKIIDCAIGDWLGTPANQTQTILQAIQGALVAAGVKGTPRVQ